MRYLCWAVLAAFLLNTGLASEVDPPFRLAPVFSLRSFFRYQRSSGRRSRASRIPIPCAGSW